MLINLLSKYLNTNFLILKFNVYRGNGCLKVYLNPIIILKTTNVETIVSSPKNRTKCYYSNRIKANSKMCFIKLPGIILNQRYMA